MKKLMLVLLISFVISGVIISCSCAGEASFCQELQDTTDVYLHPKYVIRATKLEDIMHGMVVKIEKQYINEIEEDTITIWGDPGHLCRVYTSNFAIGDEIILGVNKLEEDGPMPGESAGDFWLPACGVTYLRVEGEMVTGQISMTVNSMYLTDFENYMFNEEYLTSCLSTSSNEPSGGIMEIVVYPNPTGRFVQVNLKNSESVPAIQLYNSIGEEQQINYNFNFSNATLDIGNLADGIYFVKMVFPQREFIRKIILSKN